MSVYSLSNNGGTFSSMLPLREYNTRVVNITNEVGNRIQNHIKQKEMVKKIIKESNDMTSNKRIDTYV